MIISPIHTILDFANSDLVTGIANISQFYNIYQSTKAGTYAQLNHDLDGQTSKIEQALQDYTQKILSETLEEIKKTFAQNETIISQNEKIISLLSRDDGKTE